MKGRFANKLRRDGLPKAYTVRVKYVNGSSGVYGYAEESEIEDAVCEAMRAPSVSDAKAFKRVIDLK